MKALVLGSGAREHAARSPARAKLAPVPSNAVEVEMTGKVILPASAAGKAEQVLLFVAANDCLDPHAKPLGVVRVGETGSFFAEVFAAPGTLLSLCAAVDEGKGKPSTSYGALPRKLRAEGKGEVVFSKLEIKLDQGEPHLFARP